MDEENVRLVSTNARTFIPISESELAAFGVTREAKYVQTLEELREDPPNIVISECVKETSFMQNNYKHQTVYKRNKYVKNRKLLLNLWRRLHVIWKRVVWILIN